MPQQSTEFQVLKLLFGPNLWFIEHRFHKYELIVQITVNKLTHKDAIQTFKSGLFSNFFGFGLIKYPTNKNTHDLRKLMSAQILVLNCS